MIYKLLLSLCICSSLNGMHKLRSDLVRIKEKHWAIADVSVWASNQEQAQSHKEKLIKMLHGLIGELEASKGALTQYVKLQRMYKAEATSIKKLIERIQ